MKKLLVMTLLLGSFGVLADHHEGHKNMSFEEIKTNMSERNAKMMASLQENKTCIDAAKDKDGLKACGKKMMEKRKEMKKKWKNKKTEMKKTK